MVGKGGRREPGARRDPRQDGRPLLGRNGRPLPLIEEPAPQLGGRRPLPGGERAPSLDQEGQPANHLVLVDLGLQLPHADFQLSSAPADALLVDLHHGLRLGESGLAEEDGPDPVLASPGQQERAREHRFAYPGAVPPGARGRPLRALGAESVRPSGGREAPPMPRFRRAAVPISLVSLERTS